MEDVRLLFLEVEVTVRIAISLDQSHKISQEQPPCSSSRDKGPLPRKNQLKGRCKRHVVVASQRG